MTTIDKYRLRELQEDADLLDWLESAKADLTECGGKWACFATIKVQSEGQPDPRTAIREAMRREE